MKSLCTSGSLKRSREVHIVRNGSGEGQIGQAGHWTNRDYYFICGKEMKIIKLEQEFLNHKIVLTVKTFCISPNGNGMANFATKKKKKTRQSREKFPSSVYTYRHFDLTWLRILARSEILSERNLRTQWEVGTLHFYAQKRYVVYCVTFYRAILHKHNCNICTAVCLMCL